MNRLPDAEATLNVSLLKQMHSTYPDRAQV